MLMMFTTYVRGLVVQLRNDEEGLALTEYVLLLGLLTGAVIAAVLLFGQNLAVIWDAWADYLGGLSAPTTTTTTTPTTTG